MFVGSVHYIERTTHNSSLAVAVCAVAAFWLTAIIVYMVTSFGYVIETQLILRCTRIYPHVNIAHIELPHWQCIYVTCTLFLGTVKNYQFLRESCKSYDYGIVMNRYVKEYSNGCIYLSFRIQALSFVGAWRR